MRSFFLPRNLLILSVQTPSSMDGQNVPATLWAVFVQTELVPKFEIFDDRLEITAAGYIHPGEEREDFFAGYSIPRNKILMRVFKDLGMVEYLGSGMPRILKAYPRESSIFSSHCIRTVFKVSEEALALEQEVMAQTDSLLAKQQDGTVGETVGEILRALRDNPGITRTGLSTITGLSIRGVEWHLAKLKADGKIKRKGSTKAGQWVVVEDSHE